MRNGSFDFELWTLVRHAVVRVSQSVVRQKLESRIKRRHVWPPTDRFRLCGFRLGDFVVVKFRVKVCKYGS